MQINGWRHGYVPGGTSSDRSLKKCTDYIKCSYSVVVSFLQTPVTGEEIYISIKTPQSQQAVILKLNKYLYGLKSSNQKFFQYFSAILCEYGLEQVQDVEALFVNDDIILLLHVDDGFILDKSAGSTASKALLQHIQSKCELQVHTCVTDYLKLYFKYSQDIYGPYLLIHQHPTNGNTGSIIFQLTSIYGA